MTALEGRAPHAARTHRDRPHGRPCWCWPSSPRSCGPTTPTPSTPATSWPGRPPTTGPAPTTSAATSSTAPWSPPGSRSSWRWWRPLIAVVVGLLLGTASFLLGRRGGRLVNAGINIAVAFPGLLLALFFAVIFGVGADRRGAGDRPGRRPGVRPAHPDPRGLRRQPATTSPPPRSPASAGCGSCSGTCSPTSPSRWSSTPPSAPAARCWPSPACRSSASACSRPPTTGAGCSSTASARSTSTRPPRSPPASP